MLETTTVINAFTMILTSHHLWGPVRANIMDVQNLSQAIFGGQFVLNKAIMVGFDQSIFTPALVHSFIARINV